MLSHVLCARDGTGDSEVLGSFSFLRTTIAEIVAPAAASNV